MGKRLFPAHAGVFPTTPPSPTTIKTFPRARGGISELASLEEDYGDFSPRTRGYFHDQREDGRHVRLFPAHAGVFPRQAAAPPALDAFPAHAAYSLLRSHR